MAAAAAAAAVEATDSSFECVTGAPAMLAGFFPFTEAAVVRCAYTCCFVECEDLKKRGTPDRRVRATACTRDKERERESTRKGKVRKHHGQWQIGGMGNRKN